MPATNRRVFRTLIGRAQISFCGPPVCIQHFTKLGLVEQGFDGVLRSLKKVSTIITNNNQRSEMMAVSQR